MQGDVIVEFVKLADIQPKLLSGPSIAIVTERDDRIDAVVATI
jgi:hypothetical protein